MKNDTAQIRISPISPRTFLSLSIMVYPYAVFVEDSSDLPV